MASQPITVTSPREVDPARTSEATAWVQAGVDLANRYSGFLGSGCVRAGETSTVWRMRYRFGAAARHPTAAWPARAEG
jgi:antibiotic biosynthesis monooxygenase (ABM) superfamily enzyme